MNRAAPTSVQSVVFEKDMAVSGNSVLIMAPGPGRICRRWRIRVSVKRRGPALPALERSRCCGYFLVVVVVVPDGVVLVVVLMPVLLVPVLLLVVEDEDAT